MNDINFKTITLVIESKDKTYEKLINEQINK